MLKVEYEFAPDKSVTDVSFSGLNGRERVTSTKEALNVMMVTNPVVDFSQKAKDGEYDDVSDDEYYQMLDTIKRVGSLWRHPDTGEDSTPLSEMNVLTLLANAIELISRQNARLKMYETDDEDEMEGADDTDDELPFN